MRINHIEVAFGDGDVHRLADRAAAVMQMRGHIGEFHEVLEILQRRVAPASIKVMNERGAVIRREHRGVSADLHISSRISGVLRICRGGVLLHDLAAKSAGEADAVAVDLGASVAKPLDRGRLAADLDADAFEDQIGVKLKERETLLTDNLYRRQFARNERRGSRLRPTFRPARVATAAAAFFVDHGRSTASVSPLFVAFFAPFPPFAAFVPSARATSAQGLLGVARQKKVGH